MKTLTIWQPWASLVAEGVKTIETRSWSAPASLIGERFAVHAAAAMPRLPRFSRRPRDRREPNPAEVAVHVVDERRGCAICWCGHDAKTCLVHGLCTLPLGAVVATARLVDCVPIHEQGCECDCDAGIYALSWVSAFGLGVGLFVAPSGNGVEHPSWGPNRLDVLHPAHPRQQRPFGDFRCGRWAWLLDDIEKLDVPVPARGKQRLWEWVA